MSRSITLFSGYEQRENRTTNYCLLMLKMLYEENPKFLSEVLSTLIDESVGDQVGVSFYQQEKRKRSVPDGLICQRPFTIYIETKNHDWFYDSQLEKHLAALCEEGDGLRILIALGNFEANDGSRFERIQGLCEKKYAGEIVFAMVTFEDFLQALQIPHLPKNVSDAVLDFRDYLNESNLLPTWKGLLDVVNCAGIPQEVVDGNVYLCPAAGGAYNHSRCQYFGMYRRKRVERVALIQAVVDIESSTTAKVKWRNADIPTEELIQSAHDKHATWRVGRYPTRVFLLDTLHPTNFVKDTKGGMLGSKQYFDISRFGVSDAAELAEALNGLTWTEVG